MKMVKIIQKSTAGILSFAVIAGFGVSLFQSDGIFSFSVEADETAADVFDADTFFVYTGSYGEKQYPLFEYYYLANDVKGSNFRHRKSYFKGTVSESIEYGDIFVTESDAVMTLDENTRNTFELAQDTELKSVGNCSDLLETKSLTVIRKTFDMATMPPSYALYTFYLTDASSKEYYYSFDSFGSDLGINISGAAQDDVLTFAVYKDSAIIPVASQSNHETATGDVNDDGAFDSADVALLQSWLLAVPDTELINWQAADFRDDDVLNACDLSLMKRQLILESEQSSYALHSVADIQTNVDNHGEWQGYIAHSENDLIDIIQESEGVTLEEAALDGINQNFFSDRSLIILYSTYSPSNQYTIIENLSMRDNTINAATVTKMPSIPRIDMLYRRYVFRVNKDDVRELTGFSFSDTDSVYSELEETIVIRWFKEWSQS